MVNFAQWVDAVSKNTNRSLAGSRFYLREEGEQKREILAQAHQWGLTESISSTDADFRFTQAAMQEIESPNRSMRFMQGRAAIDHARESMPVVRTLMGQLVQSGALEGVRFAISIVLEPKTAVFLEELASAGAIVGIYCDGESTDPRVIEELEKQGILVAADVSWPAEKRKEEALRLLDAIIPDILIDDGASFARLLMMERPQMAAHLIGVAEETTSGIRAFEAMERDGVLTYPVIAVNDSPLKTGFDNAHGTGETCVTTIQEHLGSDVFDGCAVAVIGYGPVGKGFATRIRALGASVTVCDIDPIACLRAAFDGFKVSDTHDIVSDVDMLISATGVRHTVTLGLLQQLREKAVVGVIGGIANEIAFDDIEDFQRSTRPVSSLDVPGGNTITVLADGDGVNYTVGNGNPIEIMDLSFGVQTMAVQYLLEHKGELPYKLLKLDSSNDRIIADIALQVRGYSTTTWESKTYDWRLNRFEDELAQQEAKEKRA